MTRNWRISGREWLCFWGLAQRLIETLANRIEPLVFDPKDGFSPHHKPITSIPNAATFLLRYLQTVVEASIATRESRFSDRLMIFVQI
jgi:hypothetical protein